ncbi:MAG: hypothetical protein ACLUVC_06485 [Longibaculum sp.]
MRENMVYTHEEYRSAGIAHLQNEHDENEFYYHRKLISEDTANQIVREYLNQKNRMKKNGKEEESD